jgi:hypothetical protein
MATSAERLKQYEDLYAQRQQAQDVPAFQNQFEEDYLKATDYNKDLIQQKSSALGQLQAVAPEMRERYMTGPVMSPTQQRNLIAQARQNPISDWGSAIDLLNQRGMKLQDILGKSVAGYQSQLAAQDRDLENSWRLYQDTVQQDQFNKQLTASRNTGGGSSLTSDLLKLLTGQNNTPAPKIDPRKALMSMIDEVAQLRKTKNIEGPQLDSYYRDIIQTAKDNNLNVNTEAVWQLLGNDIGKPMSLRLFY